jgi:hypothetical protein
MFMRRQCRLAKAAQLIGAIFEQSSESLGFFSRADLAASGF